MAGEAGNDAAANGSGGGVLAALGRVAGFPEGVDEGEGDAGCGARGVGDVLGVPPIIMACPHLGQATFAGPLGGASRIGCPHLTHLISIIEWRQSWGA